MFIRRTLALVMLAAQACSVAGGTSPQPLYDRLGGRDGVHRIVVDVVTHVTTDSRLKKSFSTVSAKPERREHLIQQLEVQLCAISGGPCTYEGPDMKRAHAGMGITDARFNAFMENVVEALEREHVLRADQEELMGLLGPMRRDIVEKPD